MRKITFSKTRKITFAFNTRKDILTSDFPLAKTIDVNEVSQSDSVYNLNQLGNAGSKLNNKLLKKTAHLKKKLMLGSSQSNSNRSRQSGANLSCQLDRATFDYLEQNKQDEKRVLFNRQINSVFFLGEKNNVASNKFECSNNMLALSTNWNVHVNRNMNNSSVTNANIVINSDSNFQNNSQLDDTLDLVKHNSV
jgi:hypothetical protein